MKKNYIIAGSILLSSLAHGQSLFAESPNEDITTPLPLRFTATAGIGYDDTFTTSSASTPVSSAYVNAALGADYVNYTPKTSWKMNAEVSANKYLKSSAGNNGVYYNGRLNLALNHRLSERTRYVQNTYANYGIEPNYSFSFTPTTAPSEHLYYSSDHAIGHRWTSRLATYTGIAVSGVDYHGALDKANNRRTYAVYNNFRYATGPNTTMTANFRYAKTDASGSAGDATDITASLGVEHQLSRNSYVNAQIGATYRDVDGGRSNYYSPFVSLAYNAALNNKTRLKTYANYGVQNYGTSFGSSTFDTNQTLRVGVELNYLVSHKLSLHGGVNYLSYNYSDGRNPLTGVATRDEDQSLFNPYVGFSYQLNEQTSINGSYHYNSSSSSFTNSGNLDYDRNRFQLGVSRIF